MIPHHPMPILMADDDPEDCMLAKDALHEATLPNDFRVVEDGQQLLDYLRHVGRYADPPSAPRPGTDPERK